MTEPLGEAPQGRPPASPLRRVLRVGFALVAVVLLAVALVRQWDEFVEAVSRLDVGSVTVSFFAVLVALVLNMLSWREAMAAVGVRTPLVTAARVFYLSQLGKYVPGSVWPVVAQMELTRDRGVSRLRGATGAVVSMAVGVVTSASVATLLLVLPDAEVRARYWWVAVVIPVMVAALHPAVLRWALGLLLRVTRRSTPVPSMSGAALTRSAAWSAAMWLALGGHAWLIADRLAGPDGAPYLTVTGAITLAWVVGFLFVVAPAGLGVREGALVLAMAPVLAPVDALAVALVSRVLMTMGDALAAGGAVLAHRRAAPVGTLATGAGAEASPVPPTSPGVAGSGPVGADSAED